MKTIAEIVPLLLFFAAYEYYDLYVATAVLVEATLIAVLLMYLRYRMIPLAPVVSAIVLSIFGGLTIFLQDDLFIKIKPTIVNCLFAAVLIGGNMAGRPLLRYILGEIVEMKNKDWIVLSYRWAALFVFMAVLNEVIWRNFTTDFWVQFKVFGMLPITVSFMLLQIPFLQNRAQFKQH